MDYLHLRTNSTKLVKKGGTNREFVFLLLLKQMSIIPYIHIFFRAFSIIFYKTVTMDKRRRTRNELKNERFQILQEKVRMWEIYRKRRESGNFEEKENIFKTKRWQNITNRLLENIVNVNMIRGLCCLHWVES